MLDYRGAGVMSIWREFLQDDKGLGSASRLNMVIGVIVGSFAVVWLTVTSNLGGEIFATFMLATGGVYGFGKYRESVVEATQIKADSPNQPVPVIAPPAVPSPVTIDASPQPEKPKGD